MSDPSIGNQRIQEYIDSHSHEKNFTGPQGEEAKAVVEQGFEEEFNSFVEATKQRCLAEKKELMPLMMVSFARENKLEGHAYMIEMPEPTERHKMFENLGTKFAETGGAPVHLLFSAEAHFVATKDGDRAKLPKYLKDAPDAMECLFVSGLCATGKTLFWRAHLSRDEAGNVTLLGEQRHGDGVGDNLLSSFIRGWLKAKI